MTRNIILVTAENTGVGKTFVSCALIKALRLRGHLVGARKPLESYEPGETTDSQLLALESSDNIDFVTNPQWRYDLPMAPPMAGNVLSRYIPSTEEVMKYLDSCEEDRCMTIVEGVGGPYSPLTRDGNTLSLIEVIRPKIVLLIIRSGLGAINATLLCLKSLRNEKVVVYFNYYDPSDIIHKTNIEFLKMTIEKSRTQGNFDDGPFPEIEFATDIDRLRELCEIEFHGSHL